ncbi:IS66 family insertion sequence element accessory protein TnpB [Pseudomonas mosselii]|uniref:IS66 family insertion sequence element accessory protein TnpB n=1 Tax=Pseudomonas mosselii TaxID=78327 RepID=UPI00385725CC
MASQPWLNWISRWPCSTRFFSCSSTNRANRVKILYWERNGFCLWLKRLDESPLVS